MNSENRIYCDYNATSPVAPPVAKLLASGELPMGNPSSVHATGKKARRILNEVREFLYENFNLDEKEHQLFFHSGATEGINSIVKGLALKAFKEGQSLSFYSFESDHSCLVNQKVFLETLNFKFNCIKVHRNGLFDTEHLLNTLKEDKSAIKLINWTWVNNESGVVNPLSELKKLSEAIREDHKAYFHVDAVQAPGKIADWAELERSVDAYTFSGHKFGALKGSGFSFVKESMPLCALLNGGGQQAGLRSGTENTWAILSLKVALEYLKEHYNFEEQNKQTRHLEGLISEAVGTKGEVIASSCPTRNGNTIDLLLYGVKAHTSAMVFDMAGIDLSNGSACSSGAVVPSRVLMSMGYSEEDAKSALRFSFGSYFNEDDRKALWVKIEDILKRLLS